MPVVTCPGCKSPCSVADDCSGQVVGCPRCKKPFRVGSQPAAKASPPPATPAGTVGRYQLRQKLGAGAFGAVYRAHDPALDREVALKLLHPEALASPAAVERFRREAKAAAKMLHPHIVPVYDCGEHQGAGYIASAFIEGKSLADAIPDAGLEPRAAAELTLQLLEALAYAHEQGVMHRDVKPANCLVDERGRLYLTDFGLAGSLQEMTTRLTRLGAVMGTPAYMAPEQAAGATTQVGPRSDLYGAGVVLYELLTGRVPFEGPTDVVLFNVIRTEPPKLSSLRPGVDPALEAICSKAMAKKPQDRFADAAAFAAALRGWLAASTSQSTQPAPRRQSNEPAPKTQDAAPAVRTRPLAPAPPTQDRAPRKRGARQEPTKAIDARKTAGDQAKPTQPATKSAAFEFAPPVRRKPAPSRAARRIVFAIALCLVVAAGSALAYSTFRGKNVTSDNQRSERDGQRTTPVANDNEAGKTQAKEGRQPKQDEPAKETPKPEPTNKPIPLFANRTGAARAKALEQWGGNAASEKAVAAGLAWLALHQAEDGHWSLSEFNKDARTEPLPRGKVVGDDSTPNTTMSNDVGGTALALLPFLAAGHTHKGPEQPVALSYDKSVAAGLRWLLANQAKSDNDKGYFGGAIYAHALATLAVCEAYGMTKDAALKEPAQWAVDHLVAWQHDGGGWRYAPRDPGDTSVTGWVIQALATAQAVGLHVPARTFDRAGQYLNSAETSVTGDYAYVPGQDGAIGMTAVGALCRQYLGTSPLNKSLLASVGKLVAEPPAQDGKGRAIYYEYYATQVLYHVGDERWDTWNKGKTGIRDTLIARQASEGANAGSFEGHQNVGGRLVATSLSLLTLEVYYRHPPRHRQE